MRADTLRSVLLVKSIEEAEQPGTVLPAADRERATRETLRERGTTAEALLDPAAERKLLAATGQRAVRLMPLLEQRFPVLQSFATREFWPAWATILVLLVAFASGLGLSALDGTKRIDILAFPFLGVIAWNLLVYLGLIAFTLRRVFGRAGPRGGEDSWAGRLMRRRLAPLLRRTRKVHADLGAALSEFAAEWATAASPLLFTAGRRVFHLAAAVLAVGLIAGLYLRGVVLEYRAGWESTFLGPEGVRQLLGLLFGPVAGWSGIELPQNAEQVAALRWTADGGGGDAAPWIHLIALSLGLYVIAPRLVLAVLDSLELLRLRRLMQPPASVLPYGRAVFGRGSEPRRGGVLSVTPYAYEPSAAALAGLERLAGAEGEPGMRLDLRTALRYGEEDHASAVLDAGAHRVADVHALLFSLAATPEEENQGVVIAAARDSAARARPPARLRVLVDESPYLARLGGDASLQGRIEQRRDLWRGFVAAHGLQAEILDLAAAGAAEPRA
jgi:hypothetical protein